MYNPLFLPHQKARKCPIYRHSKHICLTRKNRNLYKNRGHQKLLCPGFLSRAYNISNFPTPTANSTPRSHLDLPLSSSLTPKSKLRTRHRKSSVLIYSNLIPPYTIHNLSTIYPHTNYPHKIYPKPLFHTKLSTFHHFSP